MKSEWQQVVNALVLMDKCIHFWLGDALAYKKQEWGMYQQLAEKTGFAEETLKHDRIIAESIESGRRRPNLSFAHHETVASLSPEQQEHFLDIAEKNSLTVKGF